jgi:serine/threonine protein phosphatase PrpC
MLKKGSAFKVSAFGLSHVGKLRSKNEDCIFIDSQGRFALLADGMGGHLGGKEASHMAIDIVRTRIDEYLLQASDDIPGRDVQTLLLESFHDAAIQVYEKGQRQSELHNMGTTLIAWMLERNKISMAYVGDSRAFLIREENIYLTTIDHSFFNEQIRLGAHRSQVADLQHRHVIMRNIGLSPPSVPSVYSAPVQSGDVWLICSDGLSNKLLTSEILQVFLEWSNSLPGCCKALVEKACARGGEDNVSVILLKIH